LNDGFKHFSPLKLHVNIVYECESPDMGNQIIKIHAV